MSAFRKKCKEVERLQEQIADAYEAFEDQDERTVRTRTSKRKRATKSLSHKIKELATTLKEQVAEHQRCMEEMRLERRELEETQQQKMLSLESNFEETLTRERQKMKEEMVIQTSELEDHIRRLARQLKDAEGKLSLCTAGNSFTFSPATVARTSCTILTPNLTPTPLSTRVVDVHADPSPSTTAANGASTSRVGNGAVEYIDAADANAYLIYKQHFRTYDYFISSEGPKSANQSCVGGPYLTKWPKEWTQQVDAMMKSNMMDGNNMYV